MGGHASLSLGQRQVRQLALCLMASAQASGRLVMPSDGGNSSFVPHENVVSPLSNNQSYKCNGSMEPNMTRTNLVVRWNQTLWEQMVPKFLFFLAFVRFAEFVFELFFRVSYIRVK